jgi:hypothetical protein
VIRVVVAVALTTALVAASLPAVADARADRTDAELRTAGEHVRRAAAALWTDEDATRSGVSGARRVVTVHLPRASWAAAGVAWFAVGGAPASEADAPESRPRNRSLVAYRVRDGPTRRLRLPGVAVRTPEGPVVLREAGAHRLRLRLVRDGGRAVVVEPA